MSLFEFYMIGLRASTEKICTRTQDAHLSFCLYMTNVKWNSIFIFFVNDSCYTFLYLCKNVNIFILKVKLKSD